MNLRCLVILGGLLVLVGCVRSTPDELLSVEPRGEAQKTGQFPVFGHIPVGQTTQMTPTQKAEIEAELTRDAQIAQSRAAARGNSQTNYISEVTRLKKLAQERLDALTNRIEGESDETALAESE